MYIQSLQLNLSNLLSQPPPPSLFPSLPSFSLSSLTPNHDVPVSKRRNCSPQHLDISQGTAQTPAHARTPIFAQNERMKCKSDDDVDDDAPKKDVYTELTIKGKKKRKDINVGR